MKPPGLQPPFLLDHADPRGFHMGAGRSQKRTAKGGTLLHFPPLPPMTVTPLEGIVLGEVKGYPAVRRVILNLEIPPLTAVSVKHPPSGGPEDVAGGLAYDVVAFCDQVYPCAPMVACDQ